MKVKPQSIITNEPIRFCFSIVMNGNRNFWQVRRMAQSCFVLCRELRSDNKLSFGICE